jgi:hypothetical protein
LRAATPRKLLSNRPAVDADAIGRSRK